jgi:hypothetical protein
MKPGNCSPGAHDRADLLAESRILHEHYPGDAALADQVCVPYLTLVHERDLPGTGGISVVDPDRGDPHHLPHLRDLPVHRDHG